MDGLKTNDHAILLITHHRQFGYVVALWEVEPDARGWFVLQNRLRSSASFDSKPEQLQPFNEIITLSQTFTDALSRRQTESCRMKGSKPFIIKL